MFVRRMSSFVSKYASKILALVCVFVLALSMAACGPAAEDTEPTEDAKQEEPKENEEKDVEPVEEEEPSAKVSLGLQPSSLVKDYSSDFVVNTLKSLYSQEDNMMFSPYSFARALTTAANGSDGETLSQMLNAMGYSSLQDADDSIQSYMKSIKKASQISLASSLWIRNTYTLNEENVKAISDYFETDINSGAFDSKTVDEVNKWAKNNSDGHIEKVLKSFGDKSDMALIDVGTFDAQWDKGFNSLSRGTFHGSVSDKETQFMELTEGTTYDGSNFSAVGLEYEGGRFSFIGILPEGDLTEFIQQMSAGTLDSAISSSALIVSSEAKVLLPKFSADWSASLVDAAKAQGIEDAFDAEKADFSDLITAPVTGLSISNIIQKNYIDVNQEGVSVASKTEEEEAEAEVEEEAAEDEDSATSADEDATSGEDAEEEHDFLTDGTIPDDSTEIIFDRPFLYVIYDNWAERPIFLGTVVNL